MAQPALFGRFAVAGAARKPRERDRTGLRSFGYEMVPSGGSEGSRNNFMAGRVKFLKASGEVGNSPAPSILMAYGAENVKSIHAVAGTVMKVEIDWERRVEREFAKEPIIEKGGKWGDYTYKRWPKLVT